MQTAEYESDSERRKRSKKVCEAALKAGKSGGDEIDV